MISKYVGWVYPKGIKGVSRNPTRKLLDYLMTLIFVVSLPRRGLFEVGSRPDSRDTFFCLAKRKYPKKRPPHAAYLLRSEGFERGFLPYAAPSTGGFERTNRQDSRFACAAPEGRGTWMYRVSSPLGASHGCGALHAGAGKPLQATPFKTEERRE